jgi:cation-transporting ATPase E
LQRDIHRVIRISLVLVLYCEFLLLLRSLLQRVDVVTSVQNSTIVASLIPNGLFLSISVAYALAAVRIIRFGALVQQANAIESLSHVNVVCLDKTGTLTTNQLAVRALAPLTVAEEELRRMLGDFVATTTTRNKTSNAVLAACPGRQRHAVAEVPFSPARKWSALVLDDPGDAALAPMHGAYVLGAPEMLATSLATDSTVPAQENLSLTQHLAPLTAQGLRVLLLARNNDPTSLRVDGERSLLPTRLRPLGLVALHDELRPEAQTALEALVRAGVQPKIISGDSPETVLALARQAGMSNPGMYSGLALDQMDDAQLADAATSAAVFGRITPLQKERLVRALRQSGHYVAMIGDGVNDVLSLKQADVGIAMRSGSQATRSVADLVLMDDSFVSLVPAVAEGQRILNGMRSILELFLTRIGTVGVIVFSSLVIGEFPLALRHSSLVTLFSVGLPTVLLAFWAQPGPLPQGHFLGRLFHFVVAPVLATSVIALSLLYGTYLIELLRAGLLAPHVAPLRSLEANRALQPVAQTTLAIFLVFVGLLLVIFAAPPTRWWAVASEASGDTRPARLAVALMAVFIVLLLVPPLRRFFALAPIGPIEVGLVLAALLLWLFAVRWLWRTRLLLRLIAR